MVAYTSGLRFKVLPHLGRINMKNLMSYTPNLMLWGGASLVGALVFVEGWPLFQRTLFSKIPILGANWQKEIPAEDRPN
ncbi:similar to Saccharomyces cerevisiae YHR001W-A QCR10 Subunit of the ubiqunol-cytochrome c oxidoreductase complex which includes Cobp [Maudiozyma barnettii]|uniref:Similar to Saccharomyces cerevisiae YHR001W-A QCR10 Subunit of the ubiqunol-cytochrome c oxidoreductase complex which includes Cobp n=1 Tax=Maudiozyma barnettii TaxID=61262 RepID=A0A8H2ZLT3_9SACH|nr:ubiquinol--cytochrome-c reductase subunit 10 [Kazachstania barnettii]CAB4256402.1 similar to Saccharomyces cerevisiae YHR001W-A QCR10 Subunit of the ubiqunol-cytochrome c oxidoreductase complex which includes Cobp [Kazachstania barnettii]CAD1785011.1 similar to Saccharomyces cerevisiae YHR001W-A QCR10 Subunit of the ubiqunol-cytochrome c oxidoreductase complex which includes Cobp [Kazachstania barnettii]